MCVYIYIYIYIYIYAKAPSQDLEFHVISSKMYLCGHALPDTMFTCLLLYPPPSPHPHPQLSSLTCCIPFHTMQTTCQYGSSLDGPKVPVKMCREALQEQMRDN